MKKKNQIKEFIDYLLNSLEKLDFFDANSDISIREIETFLKNCQKKYSKNNIIKIFTDGASRGNPGKAGAGFVIFDANGNIFKKGRKFLGIKTNNEAEYLALILALKEAKSLNLKKIHLFLDSELIVKQIKKEYKVKNSRLQELFSQVIGLLENFDYEITHIPREKNKLADKLANEAIDLQVN